MSSVRSRNGPETNALRTDPAMTQADSHHPNSNIDNSHNRDSGLHHSPTPFINPTNPPSTATGPGTGTLLPTHHIRPRTYGPGHKERLRLLLDEPSSSHLAFLVSVLIALTIVISSLTAIIETVPIYYRSQEELWGIFEIFIVGVFTLEFLIRCYAHTSNAGQFLKFLRSFYTWVDVVAILPFYLSRLVIKKQSWSDMQRFTVLRLFRLLRLFRCYTFSSLLQLSIDALIMSLRKSVDALLALMVFITFIMVAFSTLMYFAERGEWDPIRRAFIDVTGDPSQFSSIPASLWFVAEIITTVGLGDIHPKTTLGKTIAIPLMMISLLIIALPSIVIGRNFAESWAWLRSTRPFRPVLLTGTVPNTTQATTAITGTAALSAPLSTISGGAISGHLSPAGIHHLTASPPPPSTATPAGTAVAPMGVANGPFGSPGRESHFLAELSTTQLATQLPVELSRPTERIPFPAPSTDVGEHGEVILGILQELQRQNQLLERLMVANSYDGLAHNVAEAIEGVAAVERADTPHPPSTTS